MLFDGPWEASEGKPTSSQGELSRRLSILFRGTVHPMLVLQKALTAYVLAFMIASYPVENHRYTGASDEETLERYRSIAADISDVALDPDEKPVFTSTNLAAGTQGPDVLGRVKMAVLLASIARWESQYRADVDELRTLGDGGLALCLLQIHPWRGETISDRASCLRSGMRHIRASYRACKNLSGYTVGHCVEEEVEAKRRVDLAKKWMREHPFSWS
jgi:hypothetical protein